MFLLIEYNKMIDPYTEYMGIGAIVFKQFFLEFK
jgi:hypothetical protein